MNFIGSSFDYDDESLVSCCDELPFWSAPFGQLLLDMVDYRKNVIALDIGFGTGFPLLELAMRLGTSSFIYGIDPWSRAVERARYKAQQYGVENVGLFEGTADRIPIDSGKIDCIVSNNGFNNVPDPDAVITECARVAKPGCQLVMTMNCDTTMVEFYELLRQSFREHGIADALVNIDSHICAKRPSIAVMVEKFASHGFVKTNERNESFKLRFSDGTALLQHYFIRLAFLESWLHCIPEGFTDVIISDVERKMNDVANAEGGFHLTVPFVGIAFCMR